MQARRRVGGEVEQGAWRRQAFRYRPRAVQARLGARQRLEGWTEHGRFRLGRPFHFHIPRISQGCKGAPVRCGRARAGSRANGG